MIYSHYMYKGGWRGVVLMKRGPKWTTIFEYSELRNYTIPTRDWDNQQLTECDLDKRNCINPAKLARRIDEHRKQFKRLGLFGKTRRTEKAAKDAIKLLRTEKAEEAA